MEAPDLLSAFLDYMENLDERLFYNQKETEDYLLEVIHSLERGLVD